MTPLERETIEAVLHRDPHRRTVLATLLAVQDALGYVPCGAVDRIASALGTTGSQVRGVLSFYPDLRTGPPGRHVIRVCRGEGCLANRGARLFKRLQSLLGVSGGETTGDGRFTLETVFCVGNCAAGPTVMVDDEVHGRVTGDELPALLEQYQ
jgi:NADH:ubiquinone oxidoreductase subunit E